MTRNCQVTWCDVDGFHDLHQVTRGTWHGETPWEPHRGVDVQLVVHGYSEYEPKIALVLVDSANPTRPAECDLPLESIAQLALTALLDVGRFKSQP